jgi:hypothetical protein
MGSAQSFTERQIKAAIKKGLGTAGRKYNIDESYTEWIIGVNGPRGAKAAGVPISDRHEAGVLERILDLAAIPARMHAASRGGFWVYVPKIVRAS